MKTNRKVVAAIAAAAALTGLGVTAAHATDHTDAPATTAPTYMYLHEAFRETIHPWDAINIPSLSCPTGYLVDERLSEGRIVPKGVQVLEPGGIGVTISYVTSEKVTDYWGQTLHLLTGTDAERGHSTATNWDPFSSHELVINLACTTDLGDAATDPAYDQD
ncbi:MAG TPA: hypothetical protein VFT68_08325 [Lapillicoccus sp.]|jgi:hypothetical protein|nr:hypothetical protein [Lapillicoccus sp.]